MVSYYRPNDFKRSVKSVLDNTNCPFHLIILDNSCGGLDIELDSLCHNNVTIYKSEANIGKAAITNKKFKEIVNDSSHFISIDSDVIVPKGWLIELKRSYYSVIKHEKPGIIAPVIMNNLRDLWSKQLQNNKLTMHQAGGLEKVNYYNGLYKNRYNAGPLFLIDTEFFKAAGLYYEKQLYGADDGMLCSSATKMGRFCGINSNVSVIHSNLDSTPEYIDWKKRNITKDVDQRGHWG